MHSHAIYFISKKIKRLKSPSLSIVECNNRQFVVVMISGRHGTLCISNVKASQNLLFQVIQNFNGFYELVLYSNGFGETKIPFQVIVVDQLPFTHIIATFPITPLPSFNSSTSVICLSIAVAFSTISIALLIVYWRERYCLKE